MTRRRSAVAVAAAPLRPPGWFTEPVRAWFGPDWQPATVWGHDAVTLSARARAGREARVALGDGGSVAGLSRRNDARLAELAELPAVPSARSLGARHMGPRRAKGAAMP
jgi:hypothetical protein